MWLLVVIVNLILFSFSPVFLVLLKENYLVVYSESLLVNILVFFRHIILNIWFQSNPVEKQYFCHFIQTYFMRSNPSD